MVTAQSFYREYRLIMAKKGANETDYRLVTAKKGQKHGLLTAKREETERKTTSRAGARTQHTHTTYTDGDRG